MEPVDSSTVYNGWELPASNSQLISHRGEAESHLRYWKEREDQKGDIRKGGRTKEVSEKSTDKQAEVQIVNLLEN